MDGTKRQDIKIGQTVEIVKKHDQRSGNPSMGIVKRILTKSASHPHGIKIQLESGEVAGIKNILSE